MQLRASLRIGKMAQPVHSCPISMVMIAAIKGESGRTWTVLAGDMETHQLRTPTLLFSARCPLAQQAMALGLDEKHCIDQGQAIKNRFGQMPPALWFMGRWWMVGSKKVQSIFWKWLLTQTLCGPMVTTLCHHCGVCWAYRLFVGHFAQWPKRSEQILLVIV